MSAASVGTPGQLSVAGLLVSPLTVGTAGSETYISTSVYVHRSWGIQMREAGLTQQVVFSLSHLLGPLATIM